MRLREPDRRRRGIRRTSREHLVRHRRERVEVARGSGRLTAELLRGEIPQRAHQLAGRGDRRRIGPERDPEVGQPRAIVRIEEDVARRHVPMDDPRAVGGGERLGHVVDDAERLIDAEWRT
jgi:hypothetical protein